MEARDVTNVESDDADGNLPSSVVVKFRGPSRKQHCQMKMFNKKQSNSYTVNCKGVK